MIEWKISTGLIPYEEAMSVMEARVAAIIRGAAPEMVWLLEHPPLYTAGTSAKPSDLLTPEALPVHYTGRGGQFTYHGPGQRIAYVMLDLKRRNAQDVRAYVQALEEWIIRSLAAFNIIGERREGRVGIWVEKPDGSEAKIGALGIRVRKWVTYHGIALNIHPDLSHFSGIVPCGVSAHGVTSYADLGHHVTMQEIDAVLRSEFSALFNTFMPLLPAL